MTDYKEGYLYHNGGKIDSFYLAVLTKDGKEQLLKTEAFNLKGSKRNILLFNDTTPEISEKGNPLDLENTLEVGKLKPGSTKTVDHSLTDIMTVNHQRLMADAELGGKNIKVVLPFDYIDTYREFS